MTNGRAYVLRPDGRFASAWVEDQYIRVILTGYTASSSSGNVGYQTTSGRFIILSEGWEYIGKSSIMQYSQRQAQALVNRIIKANKHIICNNLLCARYANKLTAQQQSKVRDLQTRLAERNNALQAGGVCTNVQVSYPDGYSEFEPYMDALMSGETIGMTTWAIVVIAAVVVASLSTAAYYMYQYYAQQAEQDVKFSDELTAILAERLTLEEYQQLMDETRGIVTKARIKQSLSTGAKTALIVAALVAAGGLVVMNELKKG